MVEGRNVTDNKIIINGRLAQSPSVGFKMGLVKIVLFAALFTIGYAEVVVTSTCEETNEDICKIGEVTVDPCRGGKVCSFKQGSDAALSFNFTPNFATSKLKTMVYWAQNTGDLAFLGFGSDDACTYTSCPTVPSQTQTLNYDLHVGRKLPKGRYNLKWKVWNEDNPSDQCCFKFSINLTKAKSK